MWEFLFTFKISRLIASHTRGRVNLVTVVLPLIEHRINKSTKRIRPFAQALQAGDGSNSVIITMVTETFLIVRKTMVPRKKLKLPCTNLLKPKYDFKEIPLRHLIYLLLSFLLKSHISRG